MIDAAVEGHNVFIPATAGSGKSFTLRELAVALEGAGQCLYVTFGRRNADEAAEKMPGHVTCASFHQLGHRIMRTYFFSKFRQMLLNEGKLQDMYLGPLQTPGAKWSDGADLSIAKFLASLHERVQSTLQAPSVQVVGEALRGLDTLPSSAEAEQYFRLRGKNLLSVDFLSSIMAWGFKESRRLAMKGVVNFHDLLTLPLELDLVQREYAWVFVDEAQDLNVVQHAWVKRLGVKYALAGDEYQSIMGFTGSNRKLMKQLADELGCVTRPLSICFRCGVDIIRLARPFTDRIEPAPGAVQGEVIHLTPEEMGVALRGGDLILARTTAQLFGAAFRMAREGFPVTVRGRDLVGRMIRTLKRALSTPENRVRLTDAFSVGFVRERVLTVIADLEAEDGPRRATALREVDVLQCALSTAEEAALSYEELSLEIIQETAESLFHSFSPATSLNFMTAHAAKGLEANRVVILSEGFPHPDGDEEEENNLIFVALTRAKKSLLFVNEGSAPHWSRLPAPDADQKTGQAVSA